jgi:hypothetical protein
MGVAQNGTSPAAPPWRISLMDSVAQRVRPIVAFDFDGTLTVRDSFTGFLPGAWAAAGIWRASRGSRRRSWATCPTVTAGG